MVAPARIADLMREAGNSPELPDGIAITFQLEGDGGGIWTVVRHRGGAELRFGDIDRADCRFSGTVDDFSAWYRGDLDLIRAHVEQRVQLEGDVGLILRIRRNLQG
ncbi:MAG: SCP2 sterol-binding domain-containing protein [Myxococcota bacterium]